MKKMVLAAINKVQQSTSRERLYLKAITSLPMTRPLCLVDVGSAKGMPDRWAKIKSAVFSYGFEPDEGARKKLDQNLTYEGGGNIDSPFALSDRTGKIELNVLKKPSHSSVLEPNSALISLYREKHPEGFELDYKITVDARELDSVDCMAKDFVKIDVQGHEAQVLRGAENSLHEILGLEVEVEFAELYKNCCSFDEIKSILAEKEIQFVDFISLTRWERDSAKNTLGSCIGGDALFLRSPESIFEMCRSDCDKLSAYLSVCLIYKRHDLIDVTLNLFDLNENEKYSEFIKINNALRKRLNFADRLARISNHGIRFFVSDVDSTPMFY